MIHTLSRKSGVAYFVQGMGLLLKPRIRTFVLLPLLANMLLFAGAFYWLWQQLDALSAWLETSLPGWLSWLEWLLWPLAIVSLLVSFALLFGILANWIAAPFNGLLAERVEEYLTQQPAQPVGLAGLLKDLPRLLGREWLKLKYYLPRALGCLLLFFVPVIGQTVAPLVWFLFTAWMMGIQYCDYPFDNHKVPFASMRSALGREKATTLGFGAMTALLGSLPIINFFIMPVAICGATAMWVDIYRQEQLGRSATR